jgi:hypothetical protein
VLEIREQLEIADDIIHFLETFGYLSEARRLKQDFTTPTRKQILVDKLREEREQADKELEANIEARISASAPRAVAPRTGPLDTLAQIDSILGGQFQSTVSAALPNHHIDNPAVRRVKRKVFAGVILPLTVGGKRRRVESNKNLPESKRTRGRIG